MSKLDWSEKTGVMTLPEVVTLESLPQLLKPKGILKLSVSEVDFAKVKQVDSAILALLLRWSNNIQSPLAIANIPTGLKTLIQLYDLESVFQVK